MGCNCRKNNMNNNEPEFRKDEIKEANTLSKKISMVQSFATALTSRGLKNERVNKPIKQLRVLSCFGNKDQDGQLPPCEYLKQSTADGRFFCGGCGCGDKKGTWLNAEGNEYSKLDYPKLNCPLQMPGFTNYKPSSPEEAVSPITRRYYIENISYKELEKVKVSTHEPPNKPEEQAKPE